MRKSMIALAAAVALAGCADRAKPVVAPKTAVRTTALPYETWQMSEWISYRPVVLAPAGADKKNPPVAENTVSFMTRSVNEKPVAKAVWMTTGLGVYEAYVNGVRVGEDFLKPGFTHVVKTRRSFTYDVTALLDTAAGATNVLSATVSSGWWRDGIVGRHGKKSAFRGVLELTYADGEKRLFGTNPYHWRATGKCPVTNASIFGGETFDARIPDPARNPAVFDAEPATNCERNVEFAGEILPSDGAEVCLRHDLALQPVLAYAWSGAEGAANTNDATKGVYGKVKRTHAFSAGEKLRVKPGETLVVDFAQNCAAVPEMTFRAAEGVTVTVLAAEMLNDANGERARGNDGPAGSVYRANLRSAAAGTRVVYTFGSDAGAVTYRPSFTFFGYRYLSITATGEVVFDRLASVPVTSITKAMERGTIETGDRCVNRLIANVRWGQLSNYLSVPTDCPQRDERLGWTADTQVFAEAGTFNADTRRFFHKWMRDMRDTQGPEGGFPGVAPEPYGGGTLRLGWSDAGVIVPYQVWKQFGDTAIVEENWAAMEKLLDRMAATKADHTANAKVNGNYQWADWLSFEDYESCSGKAFSGNQPKPEALVYWNYLLACYWLWDAQMMGEMAAGTGRDTEKWTKMAAEAKAYLREKFFEKDGMILKAYRKMQTPALFALKLGLVEGSAKAKTLDGLRANVKENGGCLSTGFLGTSILMDTLTANGAVDLAYDLLLNHKHPGWLYSVDQGATTIWERWNSYTKEKGFGPVSMNSFNHYAYGAVLAWIYKTAAGIAADPKAPGFANIVMAPVPDRRLGHVKAEYRTPRGVVKSAWRYEGAKWIWTFTVPAGATASVTIPGEAGSVSYAPGTYTVERSAPTCGWKPFAGNPVLGNEKLGTCFDVNVVTDAQPSTSNLQPSTYLMYFSWRTKAAIALVRSEDGFTWTQEPEICLEANPKSGWENLVNRSCTLKKDGVWHMWYTGQVFEKGDWKKGASRIGYATSSDGVHFTRVRKDPVLVPEYPFEKTSVMNPYVRWDAARGVWRMWYAAGEIYEPNVLCTAESEDGIKWVKDINNPMFGKGEGLVWDRDRVGGCEVHPLPDGRWVMFYIGYSDEDTARIGCAISPDGLKDWKRLAQNPIVSPDVGTWNGAACYKPSVVRDEANDRWLLYYNGRNGRPEYVGMAVHEGLDLDLPAAAPADTRPILSEYVRRFNAKDDELYKNAIPNEAAEDFMLANCPRLACPDKDIERTYYFRWWTFRKHIRKDLGHWTVTEFLPNVGWAGKGNTIVCPAGHHLREGRWLRDPQYMTDDARFWLSSPDATHRWGYCSWLFTGTRLLAETTGCDSLVTNLLADAVKYYERWEQGFEHDGWPVKGKFRMGGDGKGGFLSIDNYEGSEFSLGGHGMKPLFASAMWSEAKAIAAAAREAGQADLAAKFEAKAETNRKAILATCWNGELGFFTTSPSNGIKGTVRELSGYAPWYFGMPTDGRKGDWAQLADPQGFAAKYGLTFPERRAKGFVLAYEGHECQWNGPSWPFATSIALTALANDIHSTPTPTTYTSLFTSLLGQYAAAQKRTRNLKTEGNYEVVPWIDENMNPDTGDWISRTVLMSKNQQPKERGKDYNHSTFCDLVISGLVGFIPQKDSAFHGNAPTGDCAFVVDPLFPADWDYLVLDDLRYRGHDVSIRWQRGSGLSVLIDGRIVARRPDLGRLNCALAR